MAKYNLQPQYFNTKEDADKVAAQFLKDYPAWPYNSSAYVKFELGKFAVYCSHDGSN